MTATFSTSPPAHSHSHSPSSNLSNAVSWTCDFCLHKNAFQVNVCAHCKKADTSGANRSNLSGVGAAENPSADSLAPSASPPAASSITPPQQHDSPPGKGKSSAAAYRSNSHTVEGESSQSECVLIEPVSSFSSSSSNAGADGGAENSSCASSGRVPLQYTRGTRLSGGQQFAAARAKLLAVDEQRKLEAAQQKKEFERLERARKKQTNAEKSKKGLGKRKKRKNGESHGGENDEQIQSEQEQEECQPPMESGDEMTGTNYNDNRSSRDSGRGRGHVMQEVLAGNDVDNAFVQRETSVADGAHEDMGEDDDHRTSFASMDEAVEEKKYDAKYEDEYENGLSATDFNRSQRRLPDFLSVTLSKPSARRRSPKANIDCTTPDNSVCATTPKKKTKTSSEASRKIRTDTDEGEKPTTTRKRKARDSTPEATTGPTGTKRKQRPKKIDSEEEKTADDNENENESESRAADELAKDVKGHTLAETGLQAFSVGETEDANANANADRHTFTEEKRSSSRGVQRTDSSAVEVQDSTGNYQKSAKQLSCDSSVSPASKATAIFSSASASSSASVHSSRNAQKKRIASVLDSIVADEIEPTSVTGEVQTRQRKSSARIAAPLPSSARGTSSSSFFASSSALSASLSASASASASSSSSNSALSTVKCESISTESDQLIKTADPHGFHSIFDDILLPQLPAPKIESSDHIHTESKNNCTVHVASRSSSRASSQAFSHKNAASDATVPSSLPALQSEDSVQLGVRQQPQGHTQSANVCVPIANGAPPVRRHSSRLSVLHRAGDAKSTAEDIDNPIISVAKREVACEDFDFVELESSDKIFVRVNALINRSDSHSASATQPDDEDDKDKASSATLPQKMQMDDSQSEKEAEEEEEDEEDASPWRRAAAAQAKAKAKAQTPNGPVSEHNRDGQDVDNDLASAVGWTSVRVKKEKDLSNTSAIRRRQHRDRRHSDDQDEDPGFQIDAAPPAPSAAVTVPPAVTNRQTIRKRKR